MKHVWFPQDELGRPHPKNNFNQYKLEYIYEYKDFSKIGYNNILEIILLLILIIIAIYGMYKGCI